MKIWQGILLAAAIPAAVGGIVLASKIIAAPVMVANTAMNSAAGVVSKTLDSNNVIAKYEYFHDAYGVFKTRVNQVQLQKVALKDNTDPGERSRLNVELRGLQSVCMNLANAYNANATKTNVGIFQGREAPSRLDPNECQ